ITEYVSVLYDLSEEAFPSKPLADLDFVLWNRFITGVRPELACLCDFDACDQQLNAQRGKKTRSSQQNMRE
ncbi:MAG: hypothetical protein GY696_05665, partial [Gammaproteobacteria bacterium]|nr:hypothetical protein [Gammaproteobacteria bacterium]